MNTTSSGLDRPPRTARGAGCVTALLLIITLLAGVAAGVRWRDAIHSLLGHAPESGAAATSDSSGSSAQLWTCSMHPQVIQEEPGACPICHMQLVPLRQETQGGHADHTLRIDPAVVQNMGVRTAPVAQGPLHREIRAVGMLKEAEPNIHEVSLRVDGWIEKLYADTDGMYVEKGSPLFELYSPEIQQAVSELISLESRSGHGQALASVSARRLELWGISPEQINRIATLSEAPRSVTFYSPASGHVLDKLVFEGAGVTSGQRLFRIVDHHLLWLDVEVFEQDLPFITLGQTVSAEVQSQADAAISGEVVFFHPHVDPATRAATVRLALHNPGMNFRPGMYATARINTTLKDDTLLAPREALMDTGERVVAFVALGEGHFEHREVTTGFRGDNGLVEVLDGLQVGDAVVTSGQFLLDTESRLREAVQKFLTPETHDAEAAEISMDMVSGVASPETDALYTAYLQLAELLGAVPADNSPVDMVAFLEAATMLARSEGHPAHDLAATLLELAGKMEMATLEEQRQNFAPLSESMISLSERYVPSREIAPELYVLHCPMAPGSWLQAKPEVANPYYRDSMKECGNVVQQLPAGEDSGL